MQKDTFSGYMWGVAAFGFWGFVPLYWMHISSVPAVELTIHRVFWGSLTLQFYFFYSSSFRTKTISHLKSRKEMGTILLSTLLVGCNWGLFVYSIQVKQLLASSLGYFINPLFNIFLGRLFFNEQLSKAKGFAVLIAMVGIVLLAFQGDGNLFITTTIFITFGLYGALRKSAKNITALSGLYWEMLLISIPGMLYIYFLTNGPLYPSQVLPKEIWLIPLTGIVTLFPLFCFNRSVKELRYSTVGILQYLAPTFQFICGYFILKEEVSSQKLLSFGFVWVALAIYTFDLIQESKNKKRP